MTANLSPKTYAIRLHAVELDIELQLRIQAPTLIGRSDSLVHFKPDVDLESWNAHKSGVSRHHLMLIPDDMALLVKDLDSVNGTMINGKPLQPNVLYPLHSGDELTLGQLVTQVRYTVYEPEPVLEAPVFAYAQSQPQIEADTAIPIDAGHVNHSSDDGVIDKAATKPKPLLSSDEYNDSTPEIKAAAMILQSVVINKDITPRMMIYISELAVQHKDWEKNRRLAVLKTACDFGYVARDNAELVAAERIKNKYRFGMAD